MTEYVNIHGRRRGRGIRPWLLIAKITGLVLTLGGLASAAAAGILGPRPTDREGWILLREAMHSAFVPCVVGGTFLTIFAGITLWLQMPRAFLRMRWLKLKLVLIAVLIVPLHFIARLQVMDFDEMVQTASMEELATVWDRLAVALLIGFVFLLLIASIGRIKPRLGQSYTPAQKPETD